MSTQGRSAKNLQNLVPAVPLVFWGYSRDHMEFSRPIFFHPLLFCIRRHVSGPPSKPIVAWKPPLGAVPVDIVDQNTKIGSVSTAPLFCWSLSTTLLVKRRGSLAGVIGCWAHWKTRRLHMKEHLRPRSKQKCKLKSNLQITPSPAMWWLFSYPTTTFKEFTKCSPQRHDMCSQVFSPMSLELPKIAEGVLFLLQHVSKISSFDLTPFDHSKKSPNKILAPKYKTKPILHKF